MKKIKKEYIFILVLLIMFFALTYFVKKGSMDEIDKKVFNILINLKCKPLTSILFVITNLGSSIGVILILLILLIPFIKNKELSSYKYTVIDVISGVIIMKLIKDVIRRVRPTWKWISQGGFSYPSGHTISAILLYGSLILIINKKMSGKQKKVATFLASLMMILIPVSRIYFGVHYLTDVLASIILGVIILIITNIFMNKEFLNDKNKVRKEI